MEVSQLLDNHDYTQPRPLASKALSYNRTIVIPTVTEQSQQVTTPAMTSAKGWLVEQQRLYKISDAVEYPYEIVEDHGQNWFKDSFSTQKGIVELRNKKETITFHED